MKKAKTEGIKSCREAAHACEMAAAVYNGDVNDLGRAASATQTAAQWWEKLAAR